MDPWKIAVLSLVFYLGFHWIRKGEWKERRVLPGEWIFGILFSAMILAGEKIQAGDWGFQAFTPMDIFWTAFYLVVGIFLFRFLYLIVTEEKAGRYIKKNACAQEENCRKKMDYKCWALYSCILIVFWIPVWIIYFPGIVPEDATNSIAMVLGELPWDNHFPVFYSLIVGACLYIGNLFHNLNLGIAVYSVLQMVSMAMILGYFLEWLQRRIEKKVVYLGLAFFCAAPVFGNYAIVMWKDPWFSGGLLLLGLFLYEHVAQNRNSFLEKRNLIYYGVLCVLISLLRNNGIYIILLTSICLIIVYRKRVKRVAITSLAAILVIYMITGPIYQAVFSAENVFVESVGIPLQQMVRTVIKGGDLQKEDREFLNHLMPLEKYADYYNPFLVDPVKWAPEFDNEYLESHKDEFFKTWFSVLKNNFGTYVEQYLMGTYGFWHIGGDIHYEFVKGEIAENTWGLQQTGVFENCFGYAMLETIWEKYDFMPTGLLVWIAFFDMLWCWVRKKSIYMIPLLVFIGNWLTLMIATPTAFGVRYVYVMVIGLPLLVLYPWLIKK